MGTDYAVGNPWRSADTICVAIPYIWRASSPCRLSHCPSDSYTFAGHLVRGEQSLAHQPDDSPSPSPPPPSPSFFRRHLHSLFRTTSHNSRVRVFVHHKMMCFYSGGVESIPCCECRACRVIPFYPSTHPIPYPSPSLHSRKTLPDRASSGHCGAHFPRPAPAAPPPFPFPFVRCVHSPDRSPANSRYVTCLSLCILTFPG
jgi:hypothetical protein